ncbi:MAG TPA: transcription elongation factor subunit Spt4 [Candidatus Nanoarchaeia archaeon]|nr:transcription elongation factor subunit Spt4 [Candidatus Nanoarchaeia archaeon]
MSKKKVCKKCKLFVEGDTCPICKSANFSTSWQGRVYITDTENSLIANKMGLKLKGEYAIKVR